jgi:uroporphyrinogen III methyltransferase/synthase
VSEPGGAREAGKRGPLDGTRVVVTRAVDQARDFADALGCAGAEVLTRPLIRIEDAADTGPLELAALRIHDYDWVIFTSANAVGRFVRALSARGDPGIGGRPRIAAVGPATAAALARASLDVTVVPRAQTAEAVAAAMAQVGTVEGMRVLWPRASAARDDLARALENAGAHVDAIEAYRTVVDTAAARALVRELAAGGVDVLTFTSPSTVAAFADAGGTTTSAACVAVIGPVTAAEARRRGLRVDIETVEHTTAALAQAIGRYVARKREGLEPGSRLGGATPREGPEHG